MKTYRKTILKTLLAVAVLAMFLAAMAPAAYSDHHWKDSDRGGWHHKHMMGKMIKRVDIPITVTGTSDSSTTFTVQGMAIEGRKGKVMVVTLDKPLTGKYNMTSDMAYVSTGDKAMDHMGMAGMNIRVDNASNSTLPVAGASAVLSISDIRVEHMGRDYTIANFGKMSIYLPDGTVRSYDLKKPVKVIKSMERKTVVWDAYPGFTKAMGDALKGGATFPADAAPLKLTDYEASVMSSMPMTVSDSMH